MTKKLLFIFLCLYSSFFINAQNITLYQQFNGQYDYTAIGATLNPAENNLTTDPNDPNFCTINTSAAATLNIPTTQTVEAAYLYWAGSGSINTGTADLNVTLNGTINIGPDRTFSHTINTGVTTLDFFSAFKDITSIVQTTGNGTYTLSDFDLTNVISTYCGNATNFGGWSIIVIYEDLSLPYNQVNIYDGLQGVSTTSPNLLLNLNNINVVNNLGAKVGFLAWEGDASLDITETLEINGFTASNPPLNPANNNFNGTNSFTNSTTLYNMDLDFYDIQNFVNIGDTSMTIEISTGQDTILMNNLITVINSQLPDPTITIDNVTLTCNSRNIIIDYTLHNVGTETLPAGVEIGINAGGQSLFTTTSTAPIPMGGSDTFQANITLQPNIPDNFILELITNLDANGVSIIDEITAANNIDTQQIILPVASIENPAQDIALCDDVSNDGVELFNFTSNITAVLGNQQNATVTVHTSQVDADTNTNQVLNLTNYQNITNPQTIYLRVTSSVDATCYATESFDLAVLASPNPTVPNIFETCNDSTNQDGETVFDLNDLRQTILNGNTNWDVTFYDNNTDASSGNTNNLPNNYTNTQNPQTIYIRVEDTTTNCVNIFTTAIMVNELPVYNDMEDIYQCDPNNDGFVTFDLNEATAQIIGSTSNYSIVYYNSQTAAAIEDQSNDLPYIYNNTTAFAEQIWYRIEDINTGCYIVDSLNLLVGGNPTVNIPPPLVYCDEDNDGIGVFILSDLDQNISTDPNIIITYHHTQANAENDAIPLISPFANTVHYNQTIYVRVEDATSGCYSTLQATLIVEDSPQPVRAQFLDPLEACDWNTNGSEVFDLTQMEAAILANDVPPAVATDFDMRYYEDAGYTQEITVPTAYTSNGMNQTIYVVVEGLNGCTGETSFELIVHPLPPFVHPQPLELCDVNNPGDETEDFTLEDASFEISGGDNSLEVTYYETQIGADTKTNPLSSPYTNTENNQTIYVRVEDTDTGCFVSQGFTLTLVVNPLPSPQVPTDPLEVCDVDNDGFVEFDLEEQIPIIQNGETDVTITFHLTEAAAESGSNAIDTTQPFGISSANNQTIYVRATNDLTDCYVVEPLTLEVVPSPTIENMDDLYECDDETLDGFAMFDLTENDDNVLGGQDPNEVTVTYYETQADAEAGQDAIAVPGQYTNIVNPQQIFVRIEHNTTGCYDTFDFAGDNSFWIEVELYPAVVEPTDLTLCDDDYNTVPVPQTIFDLTVKEGEMSGQNSPPGNYEFTYYASDADYQAGTPIADPENYQNIANPQTLVVEVVNTDTQGLCATTVNLTINVLPLPSPDTYTPEELRLYQCDDDNDGVASEAFDLTQSGAMIAGGENVNLSYYTNQSAAEQGDTASASYIATPDQYVNDPSLNVLNADGVPVQIIYVRVESGVAGNDCYVVTSFEIQVVPAPVLNPAGQPFGYTLCEDGNSGTAAVQLDDIAENVYDPTNGDPATLVPLLDPNENDDLDINNYQVGYYFTAAAAEAGDSTQEVPNGYDASDGESFFIRIEYLSTGCYNTGAIGEVVITVEQRPAINAVDLNETLCSDEQGGNSVTVDLTQYDGQISTGAPNTAVVYYADMNAYMSGNEVADPTGFTTTDNPQTVIAEVIDTETLCESADFATITFNINTTPIVDISGYDGMIICEDLDPSTPTEGGDYTPITIDTRLSQTQYDFVWTLDGTTLPETGSSIDAAQAGTYEVTVTDVFNNCSAGSSATIGASNPPEFTATATTLAFAGEHTVVVSNVTGIGDYEFSIDNGPWTDLGSNTSLTFTSTSSAQATGSATAIGGGMHTIRGRDKNGCGTTIVTISIVDYPSFFTPNNDGYNDTWNIYGLAESDPSAKIYIFDRYGKLLKQISPMGEGWDGSYNGVQMPSGDYWFKVEYRELDMNTGQVVRKELMDNITLKR